ncbi:hypothetical protein A2X44_05265 [candidate division CPR3 bacterium GWF2_35_18]|uniref:LamG-like jellyroll fold domain-containing protein n=1 Tax=candidate division CPR3 bacterium GW2011_GWF2_35_18 TaxID=1618350 RepID=A0A0G0C172_UNCC3|nr:MAG: hypothetical protein UR67_C0003G0126 [candidate division CPR3 bacterium GW2011_GWF2_35_18]KKP87151.1 MAG: hypothetical protein UR87_C0003G0004 [candidate division CPR3 bacterium GW2011_GWE2_35_7]OGB63733.1 MAG: hypothetical protein A2X44_05265 [candidate division CPR3 bacterium GWF2_35_18]OGB64947.1 MAG: hypothetical protein A2250_00780 [candidate division CPR3 bacterium RIFOXYA2_FULL_35_13]OGB80698.1 MAG: hypothetical protein A2011_01410 [candidate division CPR3 bacterium GWE2_35_7]
MFKQKKVIKLHKKNPLTVGSKKILVKIRHNVQLFYSNISIWLINKSIIRGIKKIGLREKLLVCIFILTIIIPSSYFFFKNPKPISSAWWDENWQFRIEIPLTNSSTAETDFQIAITLDTAALIDDSKMQANCNDIRVTDINGKVLPHWIEEGSAPCNSSTTKVWTKVPSIPTSGQTLYLYYGNIGADNTQSGKNVFNFFEDFNSSSLDPNIWTTTGVVDVENGEISTRTGAIYTNSNIVSSSSGYIYEYRNKWTTTSGDYSGLMIADVQGTTSTNSNADALVYFMSNNILGSLGIPGYSADGDITGYNIVNGTLQYTATINTYYINGFSIDGTYIRFYNNRTQINEYTGIWNVAPYLWIGYFMGSNSETTDIKDITTDWIIVRKLNSNITVETLGSEEKGPGPFAYWKFDEGYETTVQDSTSNDNDGTISGATWQNEDMCINGKCLFFDGTNDSITTTSLPLSGTTYSVEAWFKTTDSSITQTVYSQRNTTDGESIMGQLYLTGGKVAFITRNDTGGNSALAQGTTTIQNNVWYHAVGIRDGTNVYIYLNGHLEGNDTDAGGIITTNVSNIGLANVGVTPGTYWKGFIDGVKIYTYARTANQLKTDYISGAGFSGSTANFGADDTNYLNQGLTGHWKLDETASPSIDVSGNSNNGTWNGNATYTTGKYGNSISLDGIGDYVIIGDPASGVLDFNTNDFTVSAWIKNSQTLAGDDNIYGITNKYSSNNSAGWSLCLRGGVYKGLLLRIGASDGLQDIIPTNSQNNLLSNGNWHFVAATRKNGIISLFIDGTLVGSATGNKSTSNSSNQIIGNYDQTGTYSFNGLIDEIRIYNKNLSPIEIYKLYNFAPSPIGYYKFDENTGTTSAYDSSSNNYTGTLNNINSSDWNSGKFGQSLNFNGSNARINLDTYVTKYEGYSSGTYSGWFKSSSSSSQYLISITDTNNTQNYTGVLINDATATYADESITFVLTRTNIVKLFMLVRNGNGYYTDGNWHHFAISLGGGNNTIYMDGVEQTVTFSTGSATTVEFSNIDTPNSMRIGNRYISNTEGSHYNGLLDDFKIYNYARTSSQIINDMNASHPAPGSPIGSAIGYWKFDDGYGTIAHDSGTGNNDLTLSSVTAWTNSGIFGKAFDGGNNRRAYAPTYTGLAPGDNEDFTLSIWFKSDGTTTAATEYLVDKGGSAIGGYQMYFNTSGQLICGIDDDDTSWPEDSATTTTDYYDTTWHHAVCTRDITADKLRLYIDGILVASDSDLSAIGSLDTNYVLVFGDDNLLDGSDEFLGNFDEIKYYNQALSYDEVYAEYNFGKAAILGSTSTDETNNPTWSNLNEYCPPGQESTCVAPIAEWKMDENNGTASIYDTSDNENTGTINGSMTNADWIPGTLGSALDFDGLDDCISTATESNFDFGTGSFTISGWFKHENIMIEFIDDLVGKFCYGGICLGSGEGGYMIYMSGGSMCFGIDDDATSFPEDSACGGSFMDNVWHYFSAVKNGTSSISIYVDGLLVATDASTTADATLDNIYDFNIGCNNLSGTTQEWDGGIDNVRVYNYARSIEQIAWEYNKGKPIGWWKFDECTGGTMYDSSINGNNGTWYGTGGGGQTSVGTCETSGTAWGNGVSGKLNASLSFDGTDDYVDLLSPSDLDDIPVKTISFWTKLNAQTGIGNGSHFINKGDTGWFVSTDPTNSRNIFGHNFSTTSGRWSFPQFSLSVWHHVLVIYDKTSVSNNPYIYVDGVSQTVTEYSTPGGSANSDASFNLLVSKSPGYDRWVDGLIDDVRIYNYTLTENQIKTLYNEGAIHFGN